MTTFFGPAHALTSLGPTKRAQYNSQMARTGDSGTSSDAFNSLLKSTGSLSPRSPRGGLSGALPPSPTDLSASYVSHVSDSPSAAGSHNHERRQGWNSRAQHTADSPHAQSSRVDTLLLSRAEFGVPAWSKFSRDDSLNQHLEKHPYWVNKAPGTYDHSHERWNLLPAPVPPVGQRDMWASFPKNTSTSEDWDSRHPVAHVLDGNPIENGNRKLSPARRRHNGGVGAD